MDFNLTPDQRLFRNTTREFLEKEMPLTKVRGLSEAKTGFHRGWWQRACELGWTSMLVPPERGGGSISGDGVLDLVIVAEEMGRLVSPGPLISSNAVAMALSEAGGHDQLLEQVMSGEKVATWAVYEPSRGWDPQATELRAERDDNDLVLDGVKDRVEAGAEADVLLVVARTAAGLAQVLVPADAAGVTVVEQESADIVRRFAEVRFQGVRVPTGAVVGAAAHDGLALDLQLDIAGLLACAEMVGATARVFEFTVEWAHDRYTFGRPLASYQALKHRFADMKTWLEACAAATGAAAHALQERGPDADELVSVAKAYVGQRATDIVQDCVQIHGGIGVTWDHDIHLYLRRVTVDRVLWGTPSEHRRRVADLVGV